MKTQEQPYWTTEQEINFLHDVLLHQPGKTRLFDNLQRQLNHHNTEMTPVAWLEDYTSTIDRRTWTDSCDPAAIKKECDWLLHVLQGERSGYETKNDSPWIASCQSRAAIPDVPPPTKLTPTDQD